MISTELSHPEICGKNERCVLLAPIAVKIFSNYRQLQRWIRKIATESGWSGGRSDTLSCFKNASSYPNLDHL